MGCQEAKEEGGERHGCPPPLPYTHHHHHHTHPSPTLRQRLGKGSRRQEALCAQNPRNHEPFLPCPYKAAAAISLRQHLAGCRWCVVCRNRDPVLPRMPTQSLYQADAAVSLAPASRAADPKYADADAVGSTCVRTCACACRWEGPCWGTGTAYACTCGLDVRVV